MALSFETDIKPLFRDKDVTVMKKVAALDLSLHEDVRDRAEDIHERLSDGSMPCDEPWPDAQIQQFKQWMDEGSAP